MTVIYVAVANKGDPGEGHAIIRIVHTDGSEASELIHEKRITSHRLELAAALHAAKLAPTNERVTIVTTSEYVYNGATKWMSGWAHRGWTSKSGAKLANTDLWKELLALGDRKITWFKDSSANPIEAVTKRLHEELARWKGDGITGLSMTMMVMDEAQTTSTPPWEEPKEEKAPEPERVVPINYGIW